MKKLLRSIAPLLTSILFLVLGTNLASSQDYNRGLEAYNAGDFATALSEWKPLAKRGNASALFNLGSMYYSGKGVRKNYTEAVKLYRLAAEKGDTNAQYSLGLLYTKGNGVLKNTTEALKWFLLSAKRGNAKGQRYLGAMYAKGSGVLQDNIIAHMWYNIASANGHETAGVEREERARHMTASAVEKATAMARECMKSNYIKCFL